MLTEGFLAVLVILAVTAGIGLGWDRFPDLRGAALWNAAYTDWAVGERQRHRGPSSSGRRTSSRRSASTRSMSRALIAVLVASFAGTTLDTATRLQRYVVQELAATFAPRVDPSAVAGGRLRRRLRPRPRQHAPQHQPAGPGLTTAHGATLFAVVTAFGLALFPGPGKEWTAETIGKGGLILWPLFGAMNQLLGGLAFLVVCFWLRRRGQPAWFLALPAVFMLAMPAWAMVSEISRTWWPNGDYLLVAIAAAALALEAWMLVEAALLWPKARNLAELPLPPLPERKEPALAGKG